MNAILGRTTRANLAAAPDRAALEDVLTAWQNLGHVIPCRDGSLYVTACWIRAVLDEQRVAARACAPCPALDPCRRHGLRHRGEAGVYGGLPETVRSAS